MDYASNRSFMPLPTDDGIHASVSRQGEDPDAITPVPTSTGPLSRDASTESPLERPASNTTSTIVMHPKQANPVKEKALPVLRYGKRSLCLLVCYLPFLIVPWVLTCILAVRPLSEPSYYNQKGEYGANLVLELLFWMGFVRVINAVGSILTVPVISALLARGAVVYSQRRKPKQALNLRQTFAMADRGWSDIPILWGAWRGKGTGSKYLWLAAGLLILSVIQAPIQQALVATEPILIMTCNDNPIWDFNKYCDRGRLPIVVAYDPEPADLAQAPQNPIVLEVSKTLASLNDLKVQLNLWHDPETSQGNVDDDLMAMSNTFFWYSGGQPGNPTYFVSAIPNGTVTGVLREHAMRLNTSTVCQHIARSDFPSPCPGRLPLSKAFNQPNQLSIEICLPGHYGTNPWNLSRDVQELEEELYIDVHVPYASDLDFGYQRTSNFTIQCKARTSRGFFELGNYRNNFTAGPLMPVWPDVATMWTEYNDYLGPLQDFVVPQTVDNYTTLQDWIEGPDPFDTYKLKTPGPLMTAGLAMFGNDSFLYVAMNSTNGSHPSAARQICQAADIPFTRLDFMSGEVFQDLYGVCNDINSNYYGVDSSERQAENLYRLLYSWFSLFNDTTGGLGDVLSAPTALDIAMFHANQAWLTQTAAVTAFFTARAIYTSPGLSVYKPYQTLAGTIIVTVLIGLQIVGLAVLIWYIHTVPTWSNALDALAVARLARSVPDEDLPPLGHVTDEQQKKLRTVDGLVGIVEEDAAEAKESSPEHQESMHADVADLEQGDSHAMNPPPPRLSVAEPAMDDASPAGLATGIKLARGAPGLITKHHAPLRKRRRIKFMARKGAEEGQEKGLLHKSTAHEMV